MSFTIIQKPTGATYAKNTVPCIVAETDGYVVATLKTSSEVNIDWTTAITVFEGSYTPDFAGRISIDFAGLYDSLLQTHIPDGSLHLEQQTDAVRLFWCRLYDGDGNQLDESMWTVYNGVLKSASTLAQWSASHFMTNQPKEKHTTHDAPEWLTFFVPGSNTVTEIRVCFYLKTGGSEEVTILPEDMLRGCWLIDVSYSRVIQTTDLLPSQLYGYYDVIVYVKGYEQFRQRYIYERSTGREKYFCFVNALGGIDTMICQGENVLQPEVTHNIGWFGNQYCALDNNDDQRKWTQNTGMMPAKWRNWIHELLTAKKGVAKYDPDKHCYTGIVLTDSDISLSDAGQLVSGSFGYMLTDTTNAIGDEERDDTLHQSEADRAEDMDDLSTRIVAVFHSDGQGAYITDSLSLPATKLYVTPDHHNIGTTVYYYFNGGHSASGSFTLDDAAHYVISKGADDTIYFTTRTDEVTALIINYYA